MVLHWAKNIYFSGYGFGLLLNLICRLAYVLLSCWRYDCAALLWRSFYLLVLKL
jgi:hypothetical protein